jgi:hypothetical protein
MGRTFPQAMSDGSEPANTGQMLAETGNRMIGLDAMGNDDHPGGTPDDRAADVPDEDPRWRPTPTKFVVALILCVAIVVPLLTMTYSRLEPRLWGFPFFYWYQFLWVFLAAGACYLSYVLLRRESRSYQAEHHTTLTEPTGPVPDDGPTTDDDREQ